MDEKELKGVNLTEQIKKEKEVLEAKKKKSMTAWAESAEEKSFGLGGMIGFTIPRLWTGGSLRKFLVILNIALVFILKGVNVFVPIVLKEAVDSIVCTEDTVKDLNFLLRTNKCPSEAETYSAIGMYVIVKFLADFINYIREIPFANMAAVAEISIAHDVYDHIQRQSLAFHLGRETGKIIRIVSRGS
jgi:ABC-type multidrug transport system fused ATPase/permease subunit